MSYGVKYYTYYQDHRLNEQHKIEILGLNYSGSTTDIINHGTDTPIINSRGGRDSKDDIVNGSEFELTILVGDDESYSDLIDSNYKDFKVRLYSGSTVLLHEGYLKPELCSRSYIDTTYYLTLSFTDGIADLKGLEFVDDQGNPYTDSQTILEVIKNCTDKIGIEFPIMVHSNMYESLLMSPNECFADKVTVNTNRFTKNQSGLLKQENCNTVLNEILKPFDCTFRQSNGYYKIIDSKQFTGNTFIYDYNTLTLQSSGVTDITINLDNAEFLDRGSLSKVSPIKKLELTFENRNLGETLLPNSDFTSGTTFWNYSGFDSFLVTTSGTTKIAQLTESFGFDVTGTEYALYSDQFNIATPTTGSSIQIQFDYKLDVTGVGHVAVKPYYQNPSGTWIALKEDYELYPADDNVWLQQYVSFDASTVGNYRIKLAVKFFHDNADYSDLRFYVKNIVVPIITVNDLTTDTFIRMYNPDIESPNSDSFKTLYGDSYQNNDVGALKVNSVLTSVWGDEDLPILYLLGRSWLTNYSKYKDYLRVSILDEDNMINIEDVIVMEGKQYIFTSFSKNLRNSTISGELIEIVTSPVVTPEFYSQNLSSVDGVGGGTINNYNGNSINLSFNFNSNLIKDSTTGLTKTWSSSKLNTLFNTLTGTTYTLPAKLQLFNSSNVTINSNTLSGTSSLTFQPATNQDVNFTVNGGEFRINTDKFYYDSDTNWFGMGTTSPQGNLEIKDTISSGGTMLNLTRGNNTIGNYLGIGFKLQTAVTSQMKTAIYAERKTGFGRSSLHLAVNSTNDTSNVGLSDARLTINESGNIIIPEFAVGSTGLVQATASGQLEKLSNGPEASFLKISSGVPTWVTGSTSVSAHTHSTGDIVSGIFPFARGGMGVSALTSGYVKSTGTVLSSVANIDWADLTNYVSITAGNGMSGGGSLNASRTITLGTPSTINGSSTNSVSSGTHSHQLTLVAADIPSLDASKITTGSLPVARGGTGTNILTGYLKGNGTSMFTASTTIPYSDLTGTPSIPSVPSAGYVKSNGSAFTSVGSIPYSDISSTPTIPTVSGTAGKLAKFTGSNAVGDSIMTEAGSTVTVTGSLVATTQITLSSDKNLKHNVAPLKGSLNKILELTGVSFNWNISKEKAIGFIAQDVEPILPELVVTDSITKTKSVNYQNMVAVLVEGIKELSDRVRYLENELGKSKRG